MRVGKGKVLGACVGAETQCVSAREWKWLRLNSDKWMLSLKSRGGGILVYRDK